MPFTSFNAARQRIIEKLRAKDGLLPQDIQELEKAAVALAEFFSGRGNTAEAKRKMAYVSLYRAYFLLQEKSFDESFLLAFDYLFLNEAACQIDGQLRIGETSYYAHYAGAALRQGNFHVHESVLLELGRVLETYVPHSSNAELRVGGALEDLTKYVFHSAVRSDTKDISLVKQVLQHMPGIVNSTKRLYSGRTKHSLVSWAYQIFRKYLEIYRQYLRSHPEDPALFQDIVKKSLEAAKGAQKHYQKFTSESNSKAAWDLTLNMLFSQFNEDVYVSNKPQRALHTLNQIAVHLEWGEVHGYSHPEQRLFLFREHRLYLSYYKILVLRNEIDSHLEEASIQWESQMYSAVLASLDAALAEYRYELDVRHLNLGLVPLSSDFSGMLSELIVFRILSTLSDSSLLQESEMHVFTKFKPSEVSYRVSLSNGDLHGDVDVELSSESVGRYAVSVKNRPLISCKKDIIDELTLFSSNKYDRAFFLINYRKADSGSIQWLRREALKVGMPIQVYDLQFFVRTLMPASAEINVLRRLASELFMLLDY